MCVIYYPYCKELFSALLKQPNFKSPNLLIRFSICVMAEEFEKNPQIYFQI